MLKKLLFFTIITCISPLAFADQAIGDSLKSLPIQSGGRVKPFDTFARDTLFFIYGKRKFKDRPAVDALMSWLLLPDVWNKTEFIQVRDSSVRKALNLDLKKNLFSPNTLLNNKTFLQEINELRVRKQNKEPLNSYFKALQKLENRLILYQAFQKGEIPGLVPPPKKSNENSWIPLAKLEDTAEIKTLFQTIINNYIAAIAGLENKTPNSQEIALLDKAVADFQAYLLKNHKGYKDKVPIELHYNHLNPLRWAWVLYLLGFIGLFLYFLFPKKSIFYGSLIIWAMAFFLQGYGMILRSLIMGRPPVTNMYETVIWVPWVSVILGAFLWLRQKVFIVLPCACMVALFCLLLADSVPNLLDGRLEPLEAVLRSNFWLSTHVLIITMSYSAFFLAFAIADALLFLFLKAGKTKTPINQKQVRLYAKCIDRSIQVGVVLLAAGTVLGGIWADYSWGRFWGWDPKETWALISLLGYLAILHGRLVGWIKEFGLAVGSILVFFLVVMAWYGVNYVLGQGLHSYGFGSGGVEYVAGFAILHIIYTILAWTLKPTK